MQFEAVVEQYVHLQVMSVTMLGVIIGAAVMSFAGFRFRTGEQANLRVNHLLIALIPLAMAVGALFLVDCVKTHLISAIKMQSFTQSIDSARWGFGIALLLLVPAIAWIVRLHGEIYIKPG